MAESSGTWPNNRTEHQSEKKTIRTVCRCSCPNFSTGSWAYRVRAPYLAWHIYSTLPYTTGSRKEHNKPAYHTSRAILRQRECKPMTCPLGPPTTRKQILVSNSSTLHFTSVRRTQPTLTTPLDFYPIEVGSGRNVFFHQVFRHLYTSLFLCPALFPHCRLRVSHDASLFQVLGRDDETIAHSSRFVGITGLERKKVSLSGCSNLD